MRRLRYADILVFKDAFDRTRGLKIYISAVAIILSLSFIASDSESISTSMSKTARAVIDLNTRYEEDHGPKLKVLPETDGNKPLMKPDYNNNGVHATLEELLKIDEDIKDDLPRAQRKKRKDETVQDSVTTSDDVSIYP